MNSKSFLRRRRGFSSLIQRWISPPFNALVKATVQRIHSHAIMRDLRKRWSQSSILHNRVWRSLLIVATCNQCPPVRRVHNEEATTKMTPTANQTSTSFSFTLSSPSSTATANVQQKLTKLPTRKYRVPS